MYRSVYRAACVKGEWGMLMDEDKILNALEDQQVETVDPDNQTQTPVEEVKEQEAQAPAPDFYTPEQLASMPKGAAVPYDRFHAVISQRNADRERAAKLEAEVQELRGKQAPAWMAQPPAWMAPPKQEQPKQPSLPEWVDESTLDPQLRNLLLQQQQQIAELRSGFEPKLQELAQWRQEQEMQHHVRQLQTWVASVADTIPDVGQDYLYELMKAGHQPDAAYKKAVDLQGRFNAAKGTQRPAAPPAPPHPKSSASTSSRAGNVAAPDLTTPKGRFAAGLKILGG